jgi:hypothetical protein
MEINLEDDDNKLDKITARDSFLGLEKVLPPQDEIKSTQDESAEAGGEPSQKSTERVETKVVMVCCVIF